jgi:hypothetical protein
MGAAVQDQKPGPYAELLRDEYCIFSTISDEQLYHLAFSEHHQPFYFFEFARIVDDAGLQFLSDADVTRMCGPRAPAAARAFLDQHPRPDRLQYWDFLNNCVWRGALLCRRDVPLAGRLEDGALRDCWISLATGRSSELVAPDPPTSQALSCLEQRRPEFVAFSDLAEDGELSTGFFMDAYTAGSIDVTFSPPTLSSRISDRPAVSPLVRLQVRDGSTVTNQKREAVRLTEVVRHVVHLLDGNHGWNELAESVADEIQSGRLADEWILRLEDDELDAGRLTGNILRHVRDRALLVA